MQFILCCMPLNFTKMRYEFMELTKSTAKVGKRYNIDGEYRYVADGDSQSLYGWVSDAPLCQMTTCSGCNTKLVSWAKDSNCPKCGKIVYLT